MTEIITMPNIYKKLKDYGLSKEYIRENGLPRWWDEELEKNPAAVLEGAGHIAKRLNLDLRSLLEKGQSVKLKQLPDTKFKYHNQQGSKPPEKAHAIASRIAEIVAMGVQKDFVNLPESVEQVRADILQSYSTIDLSALLDYCWSHGIGVIYFDKYPSGKKITGMVQWQFNRPVIVLSRKQNHCALLAFDLAHELGHLVLGHVNDGTLVDEEIEYDSLDSREIEANEFAVRLLMGNHNNCLGKLQNVLKDLNPVNGQQLINQSLEQHLDWNCYSQDDYDYLDQLLGD